jgi:outer membrane protein OmpA-like peptidoglycan-associated protein
VGSDEYNRQLSERRAQAVRDYLVQQGISADAIAASGFGSGEEVASNDTPRRISKIAAWNSYSRAMPLAA